MRHYVFGCYLGSVLRSQKSQVQSLGWKEGCFKKIRLAIPSVFLESYNVLLKWGDSSSILFQTTFSKYSNDPVLLATKLLEKIYTGSNFNIYLQFWKKFQTAIWTVQEIFRCECELKITLLGIVVWFRSTGQIKDFPLRIAKKKGKNFEKELDI